MGVELGGNRFNGLLEPRFCFSLLACHEIHGEPAVDDAQSDDISYHQGDTFGFDTPVTREEFRESHGSFVFRPVVQSSFVSHWVCS